MRNALAYNAVQEIFCHAYGWVTGNERYPLRSLVALELQNCRPKKILEVGCGSGCFAQKDFNYVGVDSNPGHIDFCKRTRPGSFFEMSAECLEFADRSFDAVLCLSVGHHLNDSSLQSACMEIKRVLKDNGVLLFADSIRPIVPSKTAAQVLEWLDEGDSFRTEEENLRFLERYFAVRKKCKLVDQFYQTLFLRCEKL